MKPYSIINIIFIFLMCFSSTFTRAQNQDSSSSSALSPFFIVDLRNQSGNFSISGRVLDQSTRAPVSGVQVSIGGSSASTDGLGRYQLSGVLLGSDPTLRFEKDNYYSQTLAILPPRGSRDWVAPTVTLVSSENASGAPVIVEGKASINGLFLAGVAIENSYQVRVNWNDTTPGEVRFYANHQLIDSISGAGPLYSVSLDMEDYFRPSFLENGNQFRVVAVGADGERSAEWVENVRVIPFPEALSFWINLAQFLSLTDYQKIAFDIAFPEDPISFSRDLPVIGKLEMELGIEAAFEYILATGEWNLSIDSPGLSFQLGNEKVTASITGRSKGTATSNEGLRMDGLGVDLGLATRFKVGQYGLPDLIPGLSTILGRVNVPLVSKAVDTVTVKIFAIPQFNGSLDFQLDPQFDFESMTLGGAVGVEAAYEPELPAANLRVYLGGEPRIKVGVPGDFLKELGFRLLAGIEVEVWSLKLNDEPIEYVFVDAAYPTQEGAANFAAERLIPITHPESLTWRPVDRPNLSRGGSYFTLQDKALAPMSAELIRSLNDFRKMGKASGLQSRLRAGDPTPSFANLPLVENVTPLASPSLAGNGEQLMLVYAEDTGADNDLQFTQLYWTWFDGQDWTTPAPVSESENAVFNPQVTWDGQGRAVAVWEQVKNPEFAVADLSLLSAEIEMVSAYWDSATQTWSAPITLTDNAVLDHQPQLSSALSDGSVGLSWIRNEANQLQGDPVSGQSDLVLFSKWNPDTRAWSPETVIHENDPTMEYVQWVGSGDQIALGWITDLSPETTSLSDPDQEIFYRTWNLTTGVWSEPTQLTSPEHADTGLQMALTAAGELLFLWNRDGEIVLAGPEQATIPVRSDATTLGFIDLTVTAGPDGNLVVLWQEMSEFGSDTFYRVYDPAGARWSRDLNIFGDERLERAFAPVWDAAGNLTVAYQRVKIEHVDKTVTLDNGVELLVESAPQPGQNDLAIFKRSLVQNLSVQPGDLQIIDASNFLSPGDEVALRLTARNSGDLPIDQPTWTLYAGDPANGGTALESWTVDTWLEGGAEVEWNYTWRIPAGETAPTLTWVADPESTITELDENDNQHTLALGGPDLELNLNFVETNPDGSVRIVLNARNLGTPTTSETTLIILPELDATTAQALATADIPALEPLQSTSIEIQLPTGTQPEGTWIYPVIADPDNQTLDINPDNHQIEIAVRLWIDTDRDGMPDSWEIENNLNPEDSADAFVDLDQDGLNNLQEYQSGADPNDAESYLRVTQLTADNDGNIRIEWGSSTGRFYTLQQTTNIILEPFQTIEASIPATPPVNIWEGQIQNASEMFFRIRVE